MKIFFSLLAALVTLSFVTLSVAGCSNVSAQPSLSLSSDAFVDGGLLGQQFTCDGAGVSPSLRWKNPPSGTKSFAVTMHHFPPAGAEKHVYMVIYNLPSSTDHLEQGSTLGSWGINTVNRKTAYAPPCSQGPGRKDYILTVYALSTVPLFSTPTTEVTMDALLDASKSTILATASLTVGYARP